MDYLLAMEHVERLACNIRRNEQHLLETDTYHENTVKVIFMIIERVVSILTYPVNINHIFYNEDRSIEGRFKYIHYLAGHHPTDKHPIYISRYESGDVTESTVSCESVMVHVTLNTVFCTDPYVDRSVVTNPLTIDWVRRSIDEIHKTLLFISPLSRIATS